MTREALRDRGWHESADIVFERPWWHQYAACRGTMRDGESDWFPSLSDGNAEAKRARRRAVALCASCPVAGPCGEAGARELYGIWNGEHRYGRRNRSQVA